MLQLLFFGCFSWDYGVTKVVGKVLRNRKWQIPKLFFAFISAFTSVYNQYTSHIGPSLIVRPLKLKIEAALQDFIILRTENRFNGFFPAKESWIEHRVKDLNIARIQLYILPLFWRVLDEEPELKIKPILFSFVPWGGKCLFKAFVSRRRRLESILRLPWKKIIPASNHACHGKPK